MGLYIHVDSEEGDALASNAGWGDVCRYVKALPTADAPSLKHLCAYGWCQDVDALKSEIPAVLKSHEPKPDVKATLTAMAKSIKAAQTLVAVTNGLE